MHTQIIIKVVIIGLNVLDLLLPREVKFFKYLDQQAEILHQNSINFQILASGLHRMNPEDIMEDVGKIRDLEIKGDNIERFIIEELDKTFITPIDREDIHAIVTGIDRSSDLINSIAQKIDIYRIKTLPKSVIRFADIIVEITKELKKLITCLRKKDNASKILKDIHALENKADNLFHISLAELFESKDPVRIIKLKDIYENLEETVNSIEHVAKVVRGILVKQG